MALPELTKKALQSILCEDCQQKTTDDKQIIACYENHTSFDEEMRLATSRYFISTSSLDHFFSCVESGTFDKERPRVFSNAHMRYGLIMEEKANYFLTEILVEEDRDLLLKKSNRKIMRSCPYIASTADYELLDRDFRPCKTVEVKTKTLFSPVRNDKSKFWSVEGMKDFLVNNSMFRKKTPKKIASKFIKENLIIEYHKQNQHQPSVCYLYDCNGNKETEELALNPINFNHSYFNQALLRAAVDFDIEGRIVDYEFFFVFPDENGVIRAMVRKKMIFSEEILKDCISTLSHYCTPFIENPDNFTRFVKGV